MPNPRIEFGIGPVQSFVCISNHPNNMTADDLDQFVHQRDKSDFIFQKET